MPSLILDQRRAYRVVPGAAAALTVLSMLVAPAGPAAAGPAGARPVASVTSVTLITGHRVRVTDLGGGRYTTDVQRPDGAIGGVHAQTIGRDLYVIPDEVLPYLAEKRVDRRLFNVTTLIRDGYDDGHSDSLPLIVGYTDQAAARGPVPDGTTKVRSLASVHGTAVRAAKRQTRRTWEAVTERSVGPIAAKSEPGLLSGGISTVWLDGKVHADLAESTAQIGAPAAWAAGLDGAGVPVAVLDTGADTDHPDLAGRISTAVSFVPGEGVEDQNGHGTHVASTVGGSGAASGGAERGVAPKADLLIGKVLSDSGEGADSGVIAGMEWAATHGARVISMSLGGGQPSDGTDPLSTAVNRLTEQTGALFVIASGNNGAEGAISAPGAADAALTVGAVDSANQPASFSSVGPRFGDYGLKPDIVAPGVEILAAKAGGNAQDGWYQSMSGTSMATPHVAGAAAILAQQHPRWRAAELKNALMSSAAEVAGSDAYQVGAGRVDVAAATAASVTATGSAYFGFVGWPHPDPAEADRSLTYTNTGDEAVTLDLEVSGEIAGGPYDTDPRADAGTPAPDMFTLSTNQVVVPAHGTASVTATAHPKTAADGRRYLGEVTASRGGQVRARTKLGLYSEEERHDLNITIRDRAGANAEGYLLLQKFGEVDPYVIPYGTSGRLELRLRPGTYSILTYLDVPGSHGPDSIGTALLGNPEIVLDRDRSVDLDARKAVEATATVPAKTADRMLYLDWYRSDGADSVLADQYLLPPWVDTMYALPTAKVTRGEFEFETRWRKTQPLLTVTAAGRPIDFLGQPGSLLYNGKTRLQAVYLATGDYSGRNVRGKAVVVPRTPDLTGSQRARAAVEAGAAMLIVVNDAAGKLNEWVGNDDGTRQPIPVLGVTARTGRTLSRTTSLMVTGSINSPFAYDLVDPHPGRIPASLAYRPRPKDLASVDMKFHGDTVRDGAEFRRDYRPYRRYSLGSELAIQFPSTRVDYLSAQPGTTWSEAAVGGANLELVSIGETRAYRPGSRTAVRFFGPVVRPANNSSFWSSTRHETWTEFNVQPWADSGTGHAGFMQTGDTLHMAISENGKLVSESAWASGFLEQNPPGTTIYKLDLHASRDAAVYRLSPATHTVWEVVSQPVAHPDDADLLPVLQMDYGIETNLAGDARGGRQQLRITPTHLPGAVGAGKIGKVTLAVSFDDGDSWQTVPATPSGTGWLATFTAPRSGFVSLSATARDTAGNTIHQEISRAYGLRP
ncbi:S8 family peptidase [Actinoplanes regularis]|uniref:Serine protease, subtilisin family n=1 Tax=Actinoplanes regularis TaxID=52697 RepID=A0A238YS96_9ACTN|nr:S8 family serine peptidase [Actinoplanes regularis]GIE85525.1 peptidase [Actinoplanes regularis]SNR74005.1 Serine protease, subtilisin family [Actinoplanes regularis]